MPATGSLFLAFLAGLAAGGVLIGVRMRRAGRAARARADAVLRAEMEDGIRKSEVERSHLRLVLSTMSEAVVAVDAERRVLLLNPAFEQFFNADAGAAIGRNLMDLCRDPRIVTLVNATLGSSAEQFADIHVISPRERFFEANAVPLELGGGRKGVLLVLHDITRVRRLESMRRDFVANVSHELRTPLAAIKGFAETLLDGALEDRDNRADFVRSIAAHAENMGRLVSDLMDLAAIESGQRPMTREALDIVEIIKEAISGVSPLARRRDVKLIMDDVPRVPQLSLDRIQMRQVFVNLVENAIKYNIDGGEVRLGVGEAGGKVVVSVRDTGPGIPPEHLPRIFERFYRVDRARNREAGGTGLGLSIVKHIVEAHGGTVRVESGPGRGTAFFVSLPVA